LDRGRILYTTPEAAGFQRDCAGGWNREKSGNKTGNIGKRRNLQSTGFEPQMNTGTQIKHGEGRGKRGNQRMANGGRGQKTGISSREIRTIREQKRGKFNRKERIDRKKARKLLTADGRSL
jgi:hypothetical protein